MRRPHAARAYNACYDLFYGHTDIAVPLSPVVRRITVIPRWDDGSADPRYGFTFDLGA